MSTDAKARGWGLGWPADRSKDMVKVTTSTPHGDVSVIVHKGIAPLVQHCMSHASDYGYVLHPGWCWGYANRPIRGSSSPSNHSWGLAVDLNAPTNPMGSKLVTDLPSAYVALWKSLGFRWGGDYSGRKDAMHFEYMGTVADAAKACAAVMGKAVLTSAGTQATEGSVCELPLEPPTHHGDEMTRTPARINLDANGGWTLVDIPFERVVSCMIVGGPDYTYDGGFHIEPAGTQTRVTLAEHANPGWVDVVVWSVDA